MGKIHMSEAELKRIQKKVQIHQITSELDVTATWVKKVERRLDKLENAAKGKDSRLDKLWKWAQEVWRREGR